MDYIPEELSQEITDKYLFVLSKKDSLRKLRADKIERRALEKMAQIQSYRMEHPNEGLPFSVPRNGNRKAIKKGVKNLVNAFRWGKANFDPNDFNESFIRELAYRVLPSSYDSCPASYREKGTSITDASTTPPYPEKVRTKEIPNFESALRDRLKRAYPIDKVETAIYAHFHLTRIHPLEDGNGRTSRVLQDIILDHNSFPLPIICSGERSTYYRILDKAVLDWKSQNNWENDRVTDGEVMFYTFMAGKINASLDKLAYSLR